MNKIIRLFLVVCCFALAACGSTRAVQSESNKEVLKEHKVWYKDTLILAPASLAEIKIPAKELEDRTPRTYTAKNGNATADVRIEKDTVFVTANCDTLALKAQIKQELITETHTESDNVQIQKQKGVSVGKLILYTLLSFIVGLVAGFIVKLFLI